MRRFTAFALGAGILVGACGCSLVQQDYITADEEFGVTLCQDTDGGAEEVVTGLPFLVPADNTDAVEVAFAELINPQNIELVESYVVRNGLTSGDSISGGTVLPEDVNEAFEPAAGAMLNPDEGEFSLALHVRTLDPSVTATFDAVRLTYTDDDANQYSTDMPSDFTIAPDCLEATP